MKKILKESIGIILICATLMITLTYVWNLSWWFTVIMLSTGPIIILGDMIYRKIILKS